MRAKVSAMIGEWESIVPKTWPLTLREAIEATLETFWAASNDYECVDNHRLAMAGNPDEVKTYLEARKSGCCGQVDECWPIDDVIVLYGFDHGH